MIWVGDGEFASYDEVPWGEASCARADCDELAIIWSDTFKQLCAQCAEDAMERQLVLAADPSWTQQLPSWNDR